MPEVCVMTLRDSLRFEQRKGYRARMVKIRRPQTKDQELQFVAVTFIRMAFLMKRMTRFTEHISSLCSWVRAFNCASGRVPGAK
jgi:hypothetical protein